ncbi:MAG TPA: L-histidine N(alpha)-methyltransferase [Oligoflexus sp.]|uniref:L-histidine N(alpha)-methyltransferase n=1 Tax=Oligoflexus sp. TaxID=1971216 RepID=UPI002D7EC0A4|nr:L-histidine N(alpha)-methyltransferase [Oligoflexus sp.]HET9237909.1 L-histidine N(alpha)-methyltransferase [Oligoflexus sp.]
MNPSNLLRSYDFGVKLTDFRQDVQDGLGRQPKSLPPKYFYDERGSQLFNQICETPEYYLTRCETQILAEHAAHMLEWVPEPILLIELGSGSSTKTRYLLEAPVAISAYMPIDIAKEELLNSTRALAERFPSVPMLPICADYTQLTDLPPLDQRETSQRLVFFPGSTLGNLDEAEAIGLLRNIHQLVAGHGFLLIGVDLIKDPHVLNAAYNDQQGVTAAFNLNLLQRINRELGADFDLDSFRHKAFFHETAGRVEMHLESLRDQIVRLGTMSITFKKGETIHTESSYKYNEDEFARFCQRAGFVTLQRWTDPQHFFAVVLLQAQTLLH